MSVAFGGHFYNKTTRKIVAAFGSLFNNITMVRYNKEGTIELERMMVPIAYGQKEKYERSIQIQLPRLSFYLTGLSYDASRKQNQMHKNVSQSGLFSQYMGTPYDFTFNLSLYVRNIEDGLQIVEQILPIFTPDYSLPMNLIDNTNINSSGRSELQCGR